MRMAIVALGLLAGQAVAADGWQDLDGRAIQSALEGQTYVYDSGARQEFRANGRTLYNAGSDSWGYWAVRGDEYCSVWPPSDFWACYRMQGKGDQVRFIGESGEATDGTRQ